MGGRRPSRGQPRGTSPVARVSGELSPGTEAVIDLAQPAGVWDLTIVCQSANGSPLSLSAAPVAKDELRPLDCSAPGGELGGAHLSITFDGGSAGTLTLRASAPAVYVYEISAHAAGSGLTGPAAAPLVHHDGRRRAGVDRAGRAVLRDLDDSGCRGQRLRRQPGPFLPEQQHAALGQVGTVDRHRARARCRSR